MRGMVTLPVAGKKWRSRRRKRSIYRRWVIGVERVMGGRK